MDNNLRRLRVAGDVSRVVLLSCISMALFGCSGEVAVNPTGIRTPTVEQMILDLQDKDPTVRVHAAIQLEHMKDARAVEPLIAALKDEDSGVRESAAPALGQQGDARAIEPLIAAFKDEDAVVQYRAQEALLQIGTPAVESLMAALQDEDPEVQSLAAQALGKLKDARAVGPLMKALRQGDTVVRYDTREALMQIGAPALESWMAALQDDDPDVQSLAAQALGELQDARAIEPLIKALKDEDSQVRYSAQEALLQIGAPAVESLIAALQDDDPWVQSLAIDALEQLKDARAVGPLIAVVKDEDDLLRSDALQALQQIGAPAVEPLCATLQDEDPDVRRLTAGALGEMKDARAVGPLIATLKDEDWYVRESAAGALEMIGAPAFEPLREALKREDLQIVAAAYRVFIEIGEKDSESMLIKAMYQYHSAEMAETFLNSGNSALATAGKEWAEANGYVIVTRPGWSGPRWGSGPG